MTIPVSLAANAYQAAQRLIDSARDPAAGSAPKAAGGPDFAQMLGAVADDVIAKGRHAEQQSLELANGNANVVDVVTAVSETEVALETLVTVRDKMISAYEEIMRMPI